MDQINRIHPKLKPYVKTLLSHEFGLQREHAAIMNVESGGIVTKKGAPVGDRFQLRILYCRKILTWQVLMCPNNLKEPPDFIMEDDFLAYTHVQEIASQIPSLVCWDPKDQNCLLNIVLQLLQLYKEFQGNQLTINPKSRYSAEYSALISVNKLSFSDIEICVHNAARVSFLVHLNVDFSKLPMPIPNVKNNVLLLIDLMFNSKNVVSIIKGREVDDIFGDVDLPELKADMYLIDYIPLVEGYLQKKINEKVSKINQRKLLYSYIVQYFEPAILDGDNITFEKISFLLEYNNSYCVVKIDVPPNFPQEPPIVLILFTKEVRSRPPIYFTPEQYPYNCKWEIKKIFESILDCLKESIFSQSKTSS